VLAGGYRLIDWRGYRGYQPGENVVELFVMGALVPEAIAGGRAAARPRRLRQRHRRHLAGPAVRRTRPQGRLPPPDADARRRPAPAPAPSRQGPRGRPLGPGDVIDLAGRRVPIVSVHDGEIGLLDNLGSLVGVPQLAKAVVKFSKSGTPAHIFAVPRPAQPPASPMPAARCWRRPRWSRCSCTPSAVAWLRGQQDRPRPATGANCGRIPCSRAAVS
jgi:pyruvate dehydrogenase E1 component